MLDSIFSTRPSDERFKPIVPTEQTCADVGRSCDVLIGSREFEMLIRRGEHATRAAC